METIALSFALAKKIQEYKNNIDVSILYEVIETAPSETIEIENVKYQKSLKYTGKISDFFGEYIDILEYYKNVTNVNYEIRYQYEFNRQEETRNILKLILKNREYVSNRLDPKYGKLRVRMSCAKCGLTDKNSILQPMRLELQ